MNYVTICIDGYATRDVDGCASMAHPKEAPSRCIPEVSPEPEGPEVAPAPAVSRGALELVPEADVAPPEPQAPDPHVAEEVLLAEVADPPFAKSPPSLPPSRRPGRRLPWPGCA